MKMRFITTIWLAVLIPLSCAAMEPSETARLKAAVSNNHGDKSIQADGTIASNSDKSMTTSIAATSHVNSSKRGNFTYRGFSGGMMIHTGYLSAGTLLFHGKNGEIRSQRISGRPFGFGGAIKFHYGPYLRIGGEGHSSSLSYGSYGSKLTVGWGGVLIDGICRLGRRWGAFAGVTIGAGSVTNLTFTAPIYNDFLTEEGVSYRRYGFATITPFVGAEYAATQYLNLTFKLDWITNVSNPQPDFPLGPRLYVGFSFYRVKR